ncbi:MAG TPA: ATP-binding protein [Candidatus Acidoferrales bacterium]|nr:ATP-binding protein [Candidatus Acidoferrales bacterium]
MATAEMRFQSERMQGRRGSYQRRPAILRLLQAERSEEIFPLLLEEIIALGYPRAMVLDVNFDSGEVTPAAALKWPRQQMEKFSTALWMSDHPLAGVLNSARPAVLTKSSIHTRPIYIHPILYSNRNLCWEADRVRTVSCLAVQNFRREKRIRLEDQVCSTCEMRAYAAVVVVELGKHSSEAGLAELADLIDLANRYLSRLFKVEHYYNRMRDMEITIAQMGTVMQSMADPVILTDTQHRVIMQNRAAERFFKVPDEMTEGLVRAVELNNLLFSAALSSMLVSGSDSHRDLTLVDAIEGEEMLFEAVSAPTYGPDGIQIGTVTVMRDVTDLRRADQELRLNYDKLREAEEVVRQDRDRLNLIIENVGDPIVVCDSQAKIVLVDPLAQELFGTSLDVARDPIQNRNQIQFGTYIDAFTYSFAERETAPLRLYNPALKQEIEYDARSGKIFDERGQVSFTVTVLRDLTAVRKVEQLKVERRMLEIEKFAATGRLAATIAHEVNNPMEAIKNAIYLLAGSIPENVMPVYTILRSETERVARIVRQMLGLYRNTEQVKPVSVNVIIEDTLLLLNRQLQRSNVEVISDLRPLPDAVIAADQIRQVLSNLVINAKDAMPNGGRLRIRSRHVIGKDDLHALVRILIGDTGTGISREMLRNIFEPFVTTKGEKGTGLGLWIVKGIIQNHGGKLSVKSKIGHGTVFRIDLPVVKL